MSCSANAPKLGLSILIIAGGCSIFFDMMTLLVALHDISTDGISGRFYSYYCAEVFVAWCP
jgi:hypothetical protein